METQYGSYFVAHRSLDIYVRVSNTLKLHPDALPRIRFRGIGWQAL
jgi:hypothetical protein